MSFHLQAASVVKVNLNIGSALTSFVTVGCNPLLAPQVYEDEAALAALNGDKTLPKWIPSRESVFYMDAPNLKNIVAVRKY